MLGAILGAIIGSGTADWLGRKSAVAITAVVFLLSALLMASASTEETRILFFAGRIGTGWCVGAGGAASNALLAETAPLAHRSQLLQLNEVMLCVGCLLAVLAANLLGDTNWRITVLLLALLSTIQLFGITLLLHESPPWLLSRGRRKEARASALALGIDPPEQDQAAEPPSLSTQKSRIMADVRLHKRPLAIALGCAVSHGILAANAVLYYSRDILQMAGVRSPLAVALLIGLVKLLGVLVALLSIKRVGKRNLLLLGTCGTILGHLGLALALSVDQGALRALGCGDKLPAEALALFSMLLFIFAWDASWAGLMYVVSATVLPQRVRAFGLGLVAAVYWLLCFVANQTLEGLLLRLGASGLFGWLAGLGTLALAFVWRFVP